jgi:hypothetical protein
MRQYWAAPIPPLHIVDGAAFAGTSLLDVSPTPPNVLPANILELGSEIEIDAIGQITTNSTGTNNLTLGFYYGGIAGVALAASTPITMTNSQTAVPFMMEYRGVVRAVGSGSSGSINGQGKLMFGTSLTALTLRAIPETLAARTVAIDTTLAKSITVGAVWSVATGNSLTCNDISVRLLA